jgi:hypothetical protein
MLKEKVLHLIKKRGISLDSFNLFYLNAILFLITIGYKQYLDDYLPVIIQVIFIIIFIASIILEFKKFKRAKDSFVFHKYKIINVPRLLFGVTIGFLFINSVKDNSIVFNVLVYSYVLYLFSGFRIFRLL